MTGCIGHFPKHRPVSTGPVLQPGYPTPVLRYPTVVIAAGRHTLNPNRAAHTRNTGNSLTRGGQQQRTEAAGVSALAGSPQPSSSALLCFGFAAHMRLSDRPTENHHAAHAWLSPWIEGRSAGSIVSLAYLDHLIGPLTQYVLNLSRPLGLARDMHQRPFTLGMRPAAIGNPAVPYGCKQSPIVALRRSTVMDGTLPRPPSVSIEDPHATYSSQTTSLVDYVPPSRVTATAERPTPILPPSYHFHRIETCPRDSLNMAAPGSL